MGQTLPNGIYLPAEGERNCYDGLEGNWRSLDGLISTVSGKASATHTHGNITNDGKLATANRVVVTDGNKVISLSGVTDTELGYLSGVTSAIQTQLNAKAGLTADNIFSGDNSFHNVTPGANNSYDLGSSSYQWNKLYAKNYYYNGVAWGLDKANTWTGNNTFTGRNSYVGIYDKLQTTAFDVRTDPESTRGGDVFRFWTGTGSAYGDYLGGMSFYQSADGSLTLQLICFGYPQTGNSVQNRINFRSARDGTSDFYPVQNNRINLGTSTNKWKSLNGINPGALSLPSGAAENINTDNWDFSWSANTVTAPFDGYISIACFGSALQINNETKSYAMTYAPGSDGFICGLLPVRSGDSIKVLVTRTQTSIYEGYKFIKASGNVS